MGISLCSIYYRLPGDTYFLRSGLHKMITVIQQLLPTSFLPDLVVNFNLSSLCQETSYEKSFIVKKSNPFI